MKARPARRALLHVGAWGAALAATAICVVAAQEAPPFARAAANGAQFARAVESARHVLNAWLAHADPETLLLPDRPERDRSRWVYTPHNSGADLYPYLVLTAQLTDPDVYNGRMMAMLRNEVRYTTTRRSLPGNFHFATRRLEAASLFGAGEYAKDGLIAVTEYLGRTPWFYRMVDLVADAMTEASISSRFGALPASDAETNGDYLQALVRLASMTGDGRFLAWARRIGDAYVEEVLPASGGVPGHTWDFQTHTGDRRLRLRDHGNETIVGLVMLFALEHQLGSPREEACRPVVQRMLDRVLASANPDGMLFNEIDVDTLKPLDARLSDNWGYVYGAVYSYYLVTGDTRYRDAVRRVLRALPKYRNFVWEPRSDPKLPLGSFDGYADAIESAIYLVNREPVAEALAWIDSEMDVMLRMQRPDGHLEDWYGEGNFNRTALLYAYMKSQGVRPERWEPGVRVGAVRDGGRLLVKLEMPAPRPIQFDFARHRRILNLDRNYVRLNEFPEWFTVDENRLYRLRPASGRDAMVKLGSELIAGVEMAPGDWIVEPVGEPPYASEPRTPAADQPAVPPDFTRLAAKARLDAPVAAWCRAEYRAGHDGAFAAAVRSPTGGGRYIALDSDATVKELGRFEKTPDLACYSRAKAEELGRSISGSDIVHGHITPGWNTTVVCAFTDDTSAVCWQYSPGERTFVQVGRWIT